MPVHRRQQQRSRKQEQKVAERLDGTATPGSGAGWAVKNDVKTEDVSLEVKYTDAKSYSLKHADLQKAEKQALLDGGREFGFLVGFGVKNGANWKIEREYVVISADYYETLREEARGNSE